MNSGVLEAPRRSVISGPTSDLRGAGRSQQRDGQGDLLEAGIWRGLRAVGAVEPVLQRVELEAVFAGELRLRQITAAEQSHQFLALGLGVVALTNRA